MGWVAAGARRIFNEALKTGSPAIYVALHTSDPGSTGASEKSGDGYTRVMIPDGGWTLPNVSASNVYTPEVTSQLDFPTPTGTYAAPITHFSYWSASTAGTFYGGFPLTAAVTPQSGIGLYFLAGTLEIRVPTDD